MNKNSDYNVVSYEKHGQNYQRYAEGGKEEELARTWLDENNVASWIHQRMYLVLDPILEYFPGAKWLTIGDGRYGSDAHYLQKKGGDALATDISDILLKEGHQAGYVKAFQKENAENLSFNDQSFDFVLCKESYHHFPRPMIALYEMLRVAKTAVIVIEPQDHYLLHRVGQILFRDAKDFIKNILGKTVNKDNFEEVGNYCYTISRREIEKVALGINLQTVAFHDSHVYYLKGVEQEALNPPGKLFKKVKSRIEFYDFLTQCGVLPGGLLTAVIFKQEPDAALVKSLKMRNFDIIELPKNPYSDF